jgi:hypothetical protein
MDYSKLVGWLVFIGGLLLIVWAIYSSYNIFTAKTAVPEIFETPQQAITQTGGTQDVQSQLQNMMSEQLKGFLPADSMVKILNLTCWSILAFILIFAGTQIAGLGIKLIKK